METETETQPIPTYSTKQVADLLNVHINTVRLWVLRGYITPQRNGENGNFRFTQEDIDNRIRPARGRRVSSE